MGGLCCAIWKRSAATRVNEKAPPANWSGLPVRQPAGGSWSCVLPVDVCHLFSGLRSRWRCDPRTPRRGYLLLRYSRRQGRLSDADRYVFAPAVLTPKSNIPEEAVASDAPPL